MATQPPKHRQSAIPPPARASALPTVGRSRSASGGYPLSITTSVDDAELSRAFADAVKANDPAQHRPAMHSLSPRSASIVQSGRRSAAGRPSSSASTSSVLSASTRAKTPASARAPSRPPSRHSDFHNQSKNRTFEVGDNVRIESLGFEGVLRYTGEIDGKPGQWAGVELSGGFAGKGKNDGSVAGKRYFACLPACGVFVALAKLSAPTVGHGTAPGRPPSVSTNNRNGRVTPAMSSGRITPSFGVYSNSRTTSATHSTSNFSSRTVSASYSTSGRVTPGASSGRTTPSFPNTRSTATTPSARPKLVMNPPPPGKATPGSRASKLASLTAKELANSRVNRSPSSPARPSPGKTSIIGTSPTRSPFTTPKALTTSKLSGLAFGKGRPSTGNTPRPRVPSAIAMPPPSSPFAKASPRRPVADSAPSEEMESISTFKLFGRKDTDSRPSSSESQRSMEDPSLLNRMQSRLDALEYENERLRSAFTIAPKADPVFTAPPATETMTTAPPADASTESESLAAAADLAEREKELEALRAQYSDAASRATKLEQELEEAQTLTANKVVELATLNQTLLDLQGGFDKAKAEDQEIVDGLKSEVQVAQTELDQLRKTLTDKETASTELEDELHVREADIANLKASLTSALAEAEEERKELNAQIDELRVAGQETIALYEERLSEVEDQRYTLERRLNSLIEKAAGQEQPEVPARMSETAIEIDNETLREQVVHLQKKISMMEDIIEDHQANAEKEEANMVERVKRLKEKEEAMKKELNDGKKDVERVLQAESHALHRVEEIGEALRESTLALENARAELESLRSEMANLDSLLEGDGDLSHRLEEFTARRDQQREQSVKEIEQLKAQLRAVREQLASTAIRDLQELQSEISNLTAQLNQAKFEVEDRDRDLRELKKRLRDVPVVNGVLDTSKGLSSGSTKTESSGKEEVTGLKHIVQELQKENSLAMNKIKMLESENGVLRSEIEQLRQEVHILEDNLDNNIQGEESGISLPDDTSLLQKRAKEQASEIEQLKKKLSDLEIKHARAIHDLSKENAELEALIEAKIYKEDDYEQEIERLKDKLSRERKKSAKTSVEPTARPISTISTSSETTLGEAVCEICERPGHDIFNCDLLKDETPSPSPSKATNSGPVCEDCESPGHVANECPYAQDVF